MTFMPTDKDSRPGIGFGTGITTMDQLREAEEKSQQRRRRIFDIPDPRDSAVIKNFDEDQDGPDEDGFMTIAGLRVNPRRIYERLTEEEDIHEQAVRRKRPDLFAKTESEAEAADPFESFYIAQAGNNIPAPPQSQPPVPQRKPPTPQLQIKIPQHPKDSVFDLFRKNLAPREGGIANRSKKADPGGLTNKGVSEKFLNDLRKRSPHWNLPKDPTLLNDKQIEDIFREEFFERTQIDKLNVIAGQHVSGSKLVEHVFDAGILSDAQKAGRWLQQSIDESIGTNLKDSRNQYDGVLGSQTRKALQQAVQKGKIKDINKRFSDKRIQFLRTRSNYPENKNGWEIRVKNLRD